ncbi:NPCBM/NEW2 domain-containing protein [Clostridium ganghwense]|uniref:NPCBM/NEW2 domain-containing protein n=1 Tax=Clostridium ganghwense TaxID=312089 RepID=A0ABT4CK28_9CLOT|nr:NPCBM/NEW2 domain-containing protein [Clostridium ganghwense]MCY6369410.1 NPCBM/NEW2 domain-containing protein [Clostridium ganghwense]
MRLLKRSCYIFFVFALVLVMLPLNKALAQGNTFKVLPEKYNIETNKDWIIDLNKEIKNSKLDGIVVQKDNVYFPVKIEILKGANNKVKIIPVVNYDNNSKYCMKIFLNNGNKYKMNFTTKADKGLKIDEVDSTYKDEKNHYWLVDDKKFLSVCGKNYLDKYTNNILGSIFYNKNLYSQDFYKDLYSNKHYIDLDKKYKRLTGIFGIDDSSCSNKCEFRLELIADGYSIFDKTMKKGEKLINVDVNLEGYEKLLIKVSKLNSSQLVSDRYDFINIKFYTN